MTLSRTALAAAALAVLAPAAARAADPGEWIVFCPYAGSAAHANVANPAARYEYDLFGNGSVRLGEAYRAAVAAPTTCETPEDHAGYLSPSVLKNGRRVRPAGSFGGRNTREKIYYTNAHTPSVRNFLPFPPGFVMQVGDPEARSLADAKAHGVPWGGQVWWGCADNSVGGKPSSPPNCRVGIVTIHTEFPSCWNGRTVAGDEVAAGNVVYPSSGRCPSSHPKVLPMLETRYEYPVGTSGRGVTLSSGGPWTYHSAFWNTWVQSGLTRLVSTCMNHNQPCGENPR